MSQHAVTRNTRYFTRIRRELNKPPGQGRLKRADIIALLDLAERGERMEPFVAHKPKCKVRKILDYAGGVMAGCDCGLNSAWAGVDLAQQIEEVHRRGLDSPPRGSRH